MERCLRFFLLFAAVGVGYGMVRGVGAVTLAQTLRVLPAFAAFWLVRDAWRRSVRVTLAVFLGTALFTSVLSIGQYIAGPDRSLLLAASVDEGSDTLRLVDDVPRVRAPGILLVYLVTCCALTYLLARRGPLWLVAATVVMVSAIAVSQNRNMFIGLVLAVVAGAWCAGGEAARRSLIVLPTLVAGIALLVSGASATVSSSAIGQRLSTLNGSSELQDGSLQDRFYENRLAEAALRRSPILGIGYGTSYGAVIETNVNGRTVVRDRQLIHNQYLGLWLRTGLGGLLTFLAFLGLGLVHARRSARAARSAMARAIAAGTFGAMCAFAFSAVAGTYLSSTKNVVAVVALLATVDYLASVRSGVART